MEYTETSVWILWSFFNSRHMLLAFFQISLSDDSVSCEATTGVNPFSILQTENGALRSWRPNIKFQGRNTSTPEENVSEWTHSFLKRHSRFDTKKTFQRDVHPSHVSTLSPHLGDLATLGLSMRSNSSLSSNRINFRPKIGAAWLSEKWCKDVRINFSPDNQPKTCVFAFVFL